MDYRLLGSTGLLVSVLGLGTLTWGKDTDQQEAASLLSLFLDAGGNLVDIPGDSLVGDGASVLGSFLGTQISRRELVICLRSGLTVGSSTTEPGPGRAALLDTLDEALAKLGTDHVDLWIVQGPRRGADLHQTLSALALAYQSGRARHVGLDGFDQWDTAYLLGTTGAGGGLSGAGFSGPSLSGGLRIEALSSELSLTKPNPGLEMLQRAHDMGVGFIGWAPLGRGTLTGKYRAKVPADSRAATSHLGASMKPYLSAASMEIVDAVQEAAKGYDCSPAQVALAWTLDLPGITATVVGPRTSRQLEQLLTGDTVPELPRPLRKVLTEVALAKADA